MTINQAKDKLRKLAKRLEQQTTPPTDSPSKVKRVAKCKETQARAIHMVLGELEALMQELASERKQGSDPFDW